MGNMGTDYAHRAFHDFDQCSSIHKIHSCSSIHKIHSCSSIHKIHSCSSIHKIHSCSLIHKIHSCSSIHKIHSCSLIRNIHSCSSIHKIHSCSLIHKIHSCSSIHKIHKIHSCSSIHKIHSCSSTHKIHKIHSCSSIHKIHSCCSEIVALACMRNMQASDNDSTTWIKCAHRVAKVQLDPVPAVTRQPSGKMLQSETLTCRSSRRRSDQASGCIIHLRNAWRTAHMVRHKCPCGSKWPVEMSESGYFRGLKVIRRGHRL